MYHAKEGTLVDDELKHRLMGKEILASQFVDDFAKMGTEREAEGRVGRRASAPDRGGYWHVRGRRPLLVEGRQEGLQEGILQGKEAILGNGRTLFARLRLSTEQAMDALDISPGKRDRIREKLLPSS